MSFCAVFIRKHEMQSNSEFEGSEGRYSLGRSALGDDDALMTRNFLYVGKGLSAEIIIHSPERIVKDQNVGRNKAGTDNGYDALVYG